MDKAYEKACESPHNVDEYLIDMYNNPANQAKISESEEYQYCLRFKQVASRIDYPLPLVLTRIERWVWSRGLDWEVKRMS